MSINSEQSVDSAVSMLFGTLPDWVPTPVIIRVYQEIERLRFTRQSNERIQQLVQEDLANHEIEVPGIVLDSVGFIDSVNFLAHVKWAISLGKSRALSELAGAAAADADLGARVRSQRREDSKKGNEKKKSVAQENQKKWLAIGSPIRSKHPTRSNTWLAAEISRKTGDPKNTIRIALPRLGRGKRQT